MFRYDWIYIVYHNIAYVLMRDPSIHIKESDLIELLKDYIPKGKVLEITKKAKKYACIKRSMVATNQKQRKVVNTLLSSDKEDASLVAQIIQMLRIKQGHTGVRKIKENGREWPQIKELTNACNSFCEVNNLDKKEGYVKYLEIAFKHIKSFYGYLSKLINLYDKVIEEYRVTQELSNIDTNDAIEMHSAYVSMIASKTGLQETYLDDPVKLNYFAKAATEAKNLGCDYDTWIGAQFDALSFCNGIPLPEQLFGMKAKERLMKYLYKYNISLDNNPNSQPKDSDWDQILNS